jgi:hypothetical protein
MNCLIDNVLMRYLNKGKTIEVIKRYIKLKYRINIDVESIKQRVRLHEMNYKVG